MQGLSRNIGFLIVAVALVSLGVWAFMTYQKKDTRAPEQVPPTVEEGSIDGIDISSLPTERFSPEVDEQDQDGDGISSEEEKALGTSDLLSDSDSDGLTDASEIEKWNTDPTKKDTDGDGHADMFEIMNGYNPAGEGVLIQ